MFDDNDDYDDFINHLMKKFNFNSELFDMDFFIFPEVNKKLDPKEKASKGFKISYHFENGMDKPEIKIEGDINEKDLQNYLKKYNLNKNPNYKILKKANNNAIIDANILSFYPERKALNSHTKEPHTEIYYCSDFTDIIFEVPGIKKENIILTLDKDGSKITFNAENNNRNYHKEISLQFKTSLENYNLDVNNGLAILRLWNIK